MKSVTKTSENVVELKSRITDLEALVKYMEALVKYYEEQFRLAKHRQFGASSEKSECDSGQLCLFNEAEAFAGSESEPDLVGIEKHYRKRTRLTTDKPPDDLPIEVVEHGLPEDEQHCAECGGELHIIGKETHRELVIISARVKIREHVRYTYVCRHCEQTEIAMPVIKAPTPEPIIRGSFASPEAIAHIAAPKFVP